MIRLGWMLGGSAELPADDEWLSPREQAVAAGLTVTKRRLDFRLGLFTAKRALARWLGLGEARERLAALEVIAAPDGSPEAHQRGEPVAASLSLGQRANLAIVAVGPAGLPLGCDIDLVESRGESFLAVFFRSEEIALVHATPRADQDLITTVLWSAKQSARKARREGSWPDTRDVAILLRGASGFGRWREFVARFPDGSELFGLWRDLGDAVVTLASAEPSEPRPLLGGAS